MKELTINSVIEQPVRDVSLFASGGSYVAVFTLRLEPHKDTSNVVFENLIEDDVPKEDYEPHIERGVREFIADLALENIRVTGIKVSLIEHLFHPVDYKAWAYKRGAYRAMKKALMPD